MRLVSNQFYDNGCSCGTNSSCTTAQGFYCRTTPCLYATSSPNQTIPGLVRSCLPIDSLLESSLQCLYNASCIQMMIQWRSFEANNLAPVPRLFNITSLDSTIKSRFSPQTTLDQIVSQLFIEDWSHSTNFSAYYHQCAPDQCTYTYEERFSIPYLISIVCGIVGGLSVALRISIPPLVILLRRIYYHCYRPATRVTSEPLTEIGKIYIYLSKSSFFT